MINQFLNTEDVAELLGVSTRTIRDLTNSRTRTGDTRPNPLPCYRISPRIIRFDREAVLGWAALHSPLHSSNSAVSSSCR